MKFLIILVFLFSCTCSVNVPEDGQTNDDQQNETTQTTETTKETEVVEVEKDVPVNFVLRGSIAVAFPVTVDGFPYDDLEVYYTKLTNDLSENDAYIEASIGFEDLYKGMVVYVISEGKRGYQGRSYVSESNTFSISLPPEAINTKYKIRGNKKISIVSDDGTRECFNFSVLSELTEFKNDNRPIILNSFRAYFSNYDCRSHIQRETKITENNKETGIKKYYGRLKYHVFKNDLVKLLGGARTVDQDPVSEDIIEANKHGRLENPILKYGWKIFKGNMCEYGYDECKMLVQIRYSSLESYDETEWLYIYCHEGMNMELFDTRTEWDSPCSEDLVSEYLSQLDQ